MIIEKIKRRYFAIELSGMSISIKVIESMMIKISFTDAVISDYKQKTAQKQDASHRNHRRPDIVDSCRQLFRSDGFYDESRYLINCADRQNFNDWRQD